MLTKEDLAILQFPFKAVEHEFLKNNAYITEGAITRRIEQVDPSWTLEQISLYNRADAANGRPITVCTMRLTINGVWRDGVGMADTTVTKNSTSEANEAEKSAATDAMKRAARLFGIGRYLLDLPSDVVDVPTMRNYLVATYSDTPDPREKSGSSVEIPTPAPTTPAQAENAPTSQPDAIAGQPAGNGRSNPTGNVTPDWFKTPASQSWGVIKGWVLGHIYDKNTFHMNGSMYKHGVTDDTKGASIAAAWKDKTAGEIVTFLENRHAAEQAAS